MNRKTVIFVLVVVLGVILDQVTKIWVVNNIEYGVGEIVIIPEFFSLVHAQNPGAAGGFLADMPYARYLFLGFTVIAVGIILDLWRRLPPSDWFMSTTMGLILSGAIGNAIDRVDKGTVTDFLLVYTESPGLKRWLIDTVGTNQWPSFNVADSALVVGVGLFLMHYLFIEEHEGEPEPKQGESEPAPDRGSAD